MSWDRSAENKGGPVRRHGMALLAMKARRPECAQVIALIAACEPTASCRQSGRRMTGREAPPLPLHHNIAVP